MSKNKFVTAISGGISKVGFQLKKHSPEILLAAGVIGTVASAVMACKASTKVNDILEKTHHKVERIHEIVEDSKNGEIEEEYTDQDATKALAIVYAQTGLEFVKLYAPAVCLGALSLTSILASNNIMRKRNLSLAAAYAAVDNGFKDYRSRLIDRFGEQLDRELKYNLKTVEIEETVVDEDSNEQVVKRSVEVADPNNNSPYARFYDDGCKGWTKDSAANLTFLLQTQNWANDLLRTRGHLFLNEVYDMLGMYRTKAGQHVGWVYNKDGSGGDNFVDFGIYDVHKPKNRDFVNGIERVILLDFNVDGDILSKLDDMGYIAY